MKIIGITGTTGSGKTTFLDVLNASGAVIADCDAIYHALLETSVDMHEELAAAFPQAAAGGEIDRRKLGEIVFSSPAALKKLEGITHKYVCLEIERMIGQAARAGKRLFGIDAIALIESGLAARCDVCVAITAPRENRIQRIMARDGISSEDAMRRVLAQKEDDYFSARCDYVLVNDGDKTAFESACKALVHKILKGE